MKSNHGFKKIDTRKVKRPKTSVFTVQTFDTLKGVEFFASLEVTQKVFVIDKNCALNNNNIFP